MELATDTDVARALLTLSFKREANQLVKVVRRHDFAQAVAYVNDVAKVADSINHHPDIEIRWNTVTLRLSTYSLGGVTDSDLELARLIDDLGL